METLTEGFVINDEQEANSKQVKQTVTRFLIEFMNNVPCK